MDDMTLLRNCELFSTLLDDDLQYLLTRTEDKEYGNGEFVFEIGQKAIHFYIIKNGAVMISQLTEDGKKHDLAQYRTGDTFGEFDFITNFPRDAEARVIQNCTVIKFPAAGHTIESMAQEQPGTISRLYLRFLGILSKRLRSIHSLIAENSIWVKQLQEEIFVDQHTALYTRSFLDTEIARLLKPPVVLLLVKPDRFKEINDTYGHQAGDAVLERMAASLLEIVEERGQCWAIRVRGNEMALVLNQADRDEVKMLARRIVKTTAYIGPRRIAVPGKEAKTETSFEEFHLTVSMAVGFYTDETQDWMDFFMRAYRIMKKAWNEGGNRIYCLVNREQVQAKDLT